MKRLAFSLWIVSAVLVAAAAQERKVSDEPAPAPKMVIDATAHDFGRVKAGVDLSHTFKIKNVGKIDLNIQSVSPG